MFQSSSIIVLRPQKTVRGKCSRECAIVQWRNESITVSLLNQNFTHWSDRDFIITSEKSLLVIFCSISTVEYCRVYPSRAARDCCLTSKLYFVSYLGLGVEYIIIIIIIIIIIVIIIVIVELLSNPGVLRAQSPYPRLCCCPFSFFFSFFDKRLQLLVIFLKTLVNTNLIN